MKGDVAPTVALSTASLVVKNQWLVLLWGWGRRQSNHWFHDQQYLPQQNRKWTVAPPPDKPTHAQTYRTPSRLHKALGISPSRGLKMSDTNSPCSSGFHGVEEVFVFAGRVRRFWDGRRGVLWHLVSCIKLNCLKDDNTQWQRKPAPQGAPLRCDPNQTFK